MKEVILQKIVYHRLSKEKKLQIHQKISNMYALAVSKLNGTYTLKQSDMDLVSWFADFIRIFNCPLWGVSGFFNSARVVNAWNHDHLVIAWTALEKNLIFLEIFWNSPVEGAVRLAISGQEEYLYLLRSIYQFIV